MDSFEVQYLHEGELIPVSDNGKLHPWSVVDDIVTSGLPCRYRRSGRGRWAYRNGATPPPAPPPPSSEGGE